MKGFGFKIEKLTEANNYFREVPYARDDLKLMPMARQPREEVGEEVQKNRDPFFGFETDSGEVCIDGPFTQVKGDDGVYVPARANRSVVNIGADLLRLYRIFRHPRHL